MVPVVIRNEIFSGVSLCPLVDCAPFTALPGSGYVGKYNFSCKLKQVYTHISVLAKINFHFMFHSSEFN